MGTIDARECAIKGGDKLRKHTPNLGSFTPYIGEFPLNFGKSTPNLG